MTGGFSATGGQIRLIQPDTTPLVQDFVGYGTAADSEGTPTIAPEAGMSIKRILDADANPIDTNNNAADFVAACGDPTPGLADTTSLPYLTGCVTPQTGTTTPPADSQSNEPTDPSSDDQPVQDPVTAPPLTYLPVFITEVLPDPATPQQDSLDEFVELYNPNDSTITLNGYTLQTGADWRYHYTLGDTPLGPHDYFAVRSAVSKLSLSNTGSGVRLIDPSGQVIFEVPTYGSAKEGQAWMSDNGVWQWTLTPTPNAPNILTVPAPKITALTAGTVPKKAAAKPKTATTKTTKAITPTLPKATKKTAASANASSQVAQTTPTPQYWLLLPIGAIAGGYALYEYRTEISRGSQKLWAKLTGRKQERTLLGDDAQDFV
jgi:hypothetical protein